VKGRRTPEDLFIDALISAKLNPFILQAMTVLVGGLYHTQKLFG
jgi:hypothetical protein